MIKEYKFNYIQGDDEHYVVIESSTDEEAVMKFFENIGFFEFGVIKSDGTYFTDDAEFVQRIKKYMEENKNGKM